MKISEELFARYEANPLALDSEVREHCGIPDSRYFEVTTFPLDRAGELRLTGERIVKTHKISKSDSK